MRECEAVDIYIWIIRYVVLPAEINDSIILALIALSVSNCQGRKNEVLRSFAVGIRTTKWIAITS